MPAALGELPDDPAELKQIVVEKHNRILALEEQNTLLKRELFGRKSEKLAPEDDAQARLFNEAEVHAKPAPAGDQASVEVKPHSRMKAGRKPLPENLTRNVIVHDVRAEEKVCGCGSALSYIGDDVTEELDVVPQKIVVNRHVRRKYACRSCEGLSDESKPAVRTAPLFRLLPGTTAAPGLLAYILVSKFCDALPFYRLEKIFSRLGVDLPRHLMCGWTVALAERLSALRGILREEIRSGACIGIDETPVQVLKEPGRKAQQKSYMWVMRGGDPDHPVIEYEYRITRGGDFLKDRLRDYSGAVMSDGYSGYTHLREMPGITPVVCWAHARRRFFEAHELSQAAGPAHVLEEIGHLYRIEKEIRGLGPPKVKKRRQNEALPVLNSLKEFLDRESAAVVPSSHYGKAVAYALEFWDRLIVYAGSGEIPIDNNAVENAIRPFVVGRKNWLFFDTMHGADAGSFFYSLIETAKANGLEPYWYLHFLFDLIPETPASPEALRELLPHRVTSAQMDRHFASRGVK